MSAPPHALSVDEAEVLRQAALFSNVTYVLFRRFADERSSQPLAFVVDNEDEHLDDGQLAKLHHELWLNGVAPLVYVGWPTRIDILSCARGPDFWHGDKRVYEPAEQLELAATIDSELAKRRRYSAFRLADGTFWEDPQNQPLANYEKAAHQSLIDAIFEADQKLEGQDNPNLRRLLLLTVLIKYLEDRGVFPRNGWFARFHSGARTFFDVLESGRPECVLRLLESLEKKFNGDVFSLPSKETLTKTALLHFSELVEARTIQRQRYLWQQYSFKHLPVEVISHLYERFVKGSTSVYTPPFLASLLLDYAMPHHRLTGTERVLDPACGSGVFLVGAFRRLVSVQRSKGESVSVDMLKSILKNQIFGVELDSDAVDLTAFSLALGVCDSLLPEVIWKELKFDRLRNSNIFEADFFDSFRDDEGIGSVGQFDVILGNPPFESAFSEPAARVNKDRVPVRGKIPDKQIAYLFLDVATELTTSDGTICLIQPSGFLYNLQSHGFRSEIAKAGRLQTLLDFTSVRNLYGADTKTVAVVLGRESNAPIPHLTFRRTYETKQRIGFVLDHYDNNRLTSEELIANPRAARANLLGGGRLSAMARRFAEMRTLSEFVAENGWLMGEGFIEGTKNRRPGRHLTGLPFLPTRELKEEGFNPDVLERVEATEFYRPGRPDLFQPPLVLIREHESLPIAFWEEGPLAYKDKIVGIHAPRESRDALHHFYRILLKRRQVLQFAGSLNGSQSLVGKATALLKGDIEGLPFPEDESELDLVPWEASLVDDTRSYFVDFVRLGQDSLLLRESANQEVVSSYASLYCRMLGSIYENLQPAEPVFLDGLICQPFFFGDEPAIEWLGPNCEEQLRSLVFDNSREYLRTVRVVRYYHQNVVFIVKPDRLRYWIRSTAIRDADDTLVDLRKQGY
ncbi:Type IIS restriction enzyme Eco57I [Planctomycetes bacterium Pan216]|uniref:site-specific DNA-methyltransferase (adenine-specific) n=1 Tax=Kolteria novifilia TaxID=2527975 RepID=A0A518AXT9_9BACT|nr:Type IIS restriction enzyme Eco57I [Planctomycetes bacterium Pan216]